MVRPWMRGFGLSDSAAYVWMPRVASTSIRRTLRCRQKPDLMVPQLQAMRAAGGLTFTFVRHPLDRFVSFWCWWQAGWFSRRVTDQLEAHGFRVSESFETAARRVCELPDDDVNVHCRPQVTLLTYDDELLPSWIGSYEWLEDDWREVAGMLHDHGVKTPSKLLLWRNRSCRKSWRSYYSKKLEAAMRERYAADLELCALLGAR